MDEGRIFPRQFWLILPEAAAIWLRLSHASPGACSFAASTGERLSNTWTTCPRVGDNPGKLGLIPHRSWVLECPMTESGSARGWVCGGLGSWRGNGPPSRRSVRAVRAGARRWTLRQGSRPYGAQQARKLRNAGNRDEVSQSVRALRGLSGCLNSTRQQGPGKAGGSRRGNTGGPSGGHFYWA